MTSIITAGGKDWTWTGDLFGAACHIEDELGQEFSSVIAQAGQGGFKAMRAVLRHSLRDGAGQKPTDDEIGEIVGALGFVGVIARTTEEYQRLIGGKGKVS